MIQRTALDRTGGELVVGTAEADTIQGGVGHDFLVGNGGADLFLFQRTDGPAQDLIYDFQSGVDKLGFADFSPKEISWHDTPIGLQFDFGGFGGQGANHGSVVLYHVHEIAPSDLVLL